MNKELNWSDVVDQSRRECDSDYDYDDDDGEWMESVSQVDGQEQQS